MILFVFTLLLKLRPFFCKRMMWTKREAGSIVIDFDKKVVKMMINANVTLIVLNCQKRYKSKIIASLGWTIDRNYHVLFLAVSHFLTHSLTVSLSITYVHVSHMCLAHATLNYILAIVNDEERNLKCANKKHFLPKWCFMNKRVLRKISLDTFMPMYHADNIAFSATRASSSLCLFFVLKK